MYLKHEESHCPAVFALTVSQCALTDGFGASRVLSAIETGKLKQRPLATSGKPCKRGRNLFHQPGRSRARKLSLEGKRVQNPTGCFENKIILPFFLEAQLKLILEEGKRITYYG